MDATSRARGWKEGQTEETSGGVPPTKPNKQPRAKDDDENEEDQENELALTGLKPWAEWH
jgi:hypothetical protein